MPTAEIFCNNSYQPISEQREAFKMAQVAGSCSPAPLLHTPSQSHLSLMHLKPVEGVHTICPCIRVPVPLCLLASDFPSHGCSVNKTQPSQAAMPNTGEASITYAPSCCSLSSGCDQKHPRFIYGLPFTYPCPGPHQELHSSPTTASRTWMTAVAYYSLCWDIAPPPLQQCTPPQQLTNSSTTAVPAALVISHMSMKIKPAHL